MRTSLPQVFCKWFASNRFFTIWVLTFTKRIPGTLFRRIPIDQIIGVAISPNGQFVVATNRQDDTVAVWDVDSGEQVAYLDPETGLKHSSSILRGTCSSFGMG